MAISTSHTSTWPCQSNSNLHSTRTLQHSTPQPLPTTSSSTRYVADFTLNLHPIYQPAHHQHTPTSAPNNTCTTHPCHQTGTTHASVRPLPIHQAWKTHDTDTSPTPWHTHLHTTFAYTHTRSHLSLLHNTPQRDITANIYFSPLVTAQHTTCSNIGLGLLKMGIMMSKTCWESVDNKHLTVASCWFYLSLYKLYSSQFFYRLMLWDTSY